jgi:hypothetical protein
MKRTLLFHASTSRSPRRFLGSHERGNSAPHSEQLSELAKALAAAQAEFTTIPKTDENPFFHSKYAGLPKIVEVASPILSKHGLSVSQFIGHDGESDTLTTWLLHVSGEYLSGTMRLRPVKNDPQAQGSATTYARRYSYMSVLGLVADEDDDGNAATKNAQPSRSGGNPKRSGGAAVKKAQPTKTADPQTGEVLHNLTKLMLDEIKGPDRQKFMDHIEKTHGVKIGAVPESKRVEVETAIGEWGAGRPVDQAAS